MIGGAAKNTLIVDATSFHASMLPTSEMKINKPNWKLQAPGRRITSARLERIVPFARININFGFDIE